MSRILIAGVGNIFMGDDAFGCEVIAELLRRAYLPPGVQALDYGIRGYDLACAMVDTFNTIILVDAMPQGKPPGTVCLIEIDPLQLPPTQSAAPDAHSLHPVAAIQMARTLGEVRARLYLVGCEPTPLANENGEMGLSDAAQNAIPRALEIINNLIVDLPSCFPRPDRLYLNPEKALKEMQTPSAP